MPVYQSSKKQPKRILVITLRYLGDTLLVTPLLASLKNAYPDAEIDVLIPISNQGMLEGNRDINRLILMQAKPKLADFIKLLLSLFKRYDLSISTQGGDRPIICAILAGKYRMGFVSAAVSRLSWKRLFLSAPIILKQVHTHMVLENLRFCASLHIKPCYKLKPPSTTHFRSELQLDSRYVVLHIMPQWQYKQWHDAGWMKVVEYIQQANCQIILTGSPQDAEQAIFASIEQQFPGACRNLVGKLSLAELTLLITNAQIFVGPDTGITHLAAATGVATIAIYGPTDPARWAPWPCGYEGAASPFLSKGSQKVANVHLLQGGALKNCVPCQLEGCERNRNSHSDCLDQLDYAEVISAIADVINENRRIKG